MRIFGLGNPLLDIQAEVDETFLSEFGIEHDAQILASSKTHALLFEAIKKKSVSLVPGGSAQNAIRVAQWVLTKAGHRNATTFAGCVGDDSNAAIMREELRKAGVSCFYETTNEETGACAVCLVGRGRSLVARLGAAEKFKAAFLAENETMWHLHDIFYTEGFFITVSPESISLVSKFAEDAGKIYAANISAPFIGEIDAYREVFMDNFPRTDVLFGNEAEAFALATGLGWSLSLNDIVCKLSTLPRKAGSRPRIVVITRGAEDTLVAEGGRLEFVPVVEVPQEEICDTNGAGDAYVGGFLAGLAQGFNTLKCCQLGATAASVVLRKIGCTC